MTRHLRRITAAAGILLGSLPAAAFAQQATTISGRVTSDARVPLQGASVGIATLGARAYTDAQGNYSFTIPASEASGQTVALSAGWIGYNTLTVQITLAGESIAHDFVLTAANDVERQTPKLSTAVTQLSSEELNTTRQQNIMEQVEGKISGVRITAPGTQGGSVNVTIRGPNHIIASNQPLFVIDGIPVSNASRGGSVANGRDYGSAISDINPEDIESMTVIKGPNGAALYGSRASNGVIVLTTKKGKASSGRIRTEITSSLTFENPSRLWDFQNQYGQGSAGAFSFVDGAGGGVCDLCDESFGPKLDAGLMIHQFTDGTDTTVKSPWVSRPNNVAGFFNTGRTFSTTASASGGTDRINGRVSVGADNISGMIPSNGFRKFSTLSSGQFQVNDHLSVSASANYVRNTGLNRPGVGYNDSILEQFVWFGRQVDVDALRNYQQGGLANSPRGNSAFNWNYIYHDNPFWLQTENPVTDTRNRLIGSVSASYKLADGLTATLRSGSDIYHYNILTESAPGGPGTSLAYNGAMSTTRDYFNENNTDLFLTGNRSLGHGITMNAMVGGNMRHNKSTSDAQATGALIVAGLYDFSNSALQPTRSQTLSKQDHSSVFGSAAFTLNDWWTVEATGRNDWPSKLLKGPSYFYPSVNTSLALTDAIPSLKKSGLSFARVRASVAQVGDNDASAYQLTTARLKPEITKSTEFGAELGAFDSRVSLDATIYSSQTRNQNLAEFTPTAVTAARVSNRGFEGLLTIIPLRLNNGLEWTTAFNYAHNKSTVTELPPNLSQQLVLGSFWYARTVAVVGQPYGQIQVHRYVRDSVTGEIMTSNGLPLTTSDYLPMGSIQPKWTGGWNNTVRYRAFTFGALLDIRRGGNIVSLTNALGNTSGVLESSLKGREIDWNNPGLVVRGIDRESCGAGSHGVPNGMYACVGGGSQNTTNVLSEQYFVALSDNMEPYVYDASYVKLRELRVGFDVPQRWTSRFNATAVNIAFVGRNLGLWTNVPNIDPEFAYSDGNAQGIEYAVVPNARSIGFSVRVTP